MAEHVDAVLRNATIYDGTGVPPFQGDVAFSGDRIVAILRKGESTKLTGDQELDCQGFAVAPGFIDAHTHDDRIVLDAPDTLPKISQGVTTVVVGNCGISLAPVQFENDPPPPMNLLGGREAFQFASFGAYASRLKATPPSVNVAALVGHSALRLRVQKDVGQKASPAEIKAMLSLADESMASGAAGFSTGLFYPTNAAADRDEVAQIASRFAAHGGVYATHMRDEFNRVLDSIDETLATAKEAHIPVIVSHHKCAGPQNWGRTKETLNVLETASETQDVNLDVYPYTAGSTNLRADLVTADYRIQITWSKPHPEMTGRDLAGIAKEWKCDLQEAARRLDPAGAIYFQMAEEDVRRVMGSRLAMIGSDGLPHDKHPHPRLWGTFPRVIGHYARDIALFSVHVAIHKMTGLTARVFRIKDRGVLKVGAYADIVVFNPATINDRATYDSPQLQSVGIDKVFVNGRLSFERKQGVVARAGRLVGGNNS